MCDGGDGSGAGGEEGTTAGPGSSSATGGSGGSNGDGTSDGPSGEGGSSSSGGGSNGGASTGPSGNPSADATAAAAANGVPGDATVGDIGPSGNVTGAGPSPDTDTGIGSVFGNLNSSLTNPTQVDVLRGAVQLAMPAAAVSLTPVGIFGAVANALGATHGAASEGESDPSVSPDAPGVGPGEGGGEGDAFSPWTNAASARPVPVPASALTTIKLPTFDPPAPPPSIPAGPTAAQRQAEAEAAAKVRRRRTVFGFGETKLTGPLGLQSKAPLFRPTAIPAANLGALGKRLGD